MREILIGKNDSSQRVDKYLLKYLNKASKSFIYKMIRKKNIKLNDKKIDGSEILIKGDKVTFFLSEETINKFQGEKRIIKPDDINLKIVFEDENIIVVNKSVGILSHPEKKTDTNTLIDKILYYLYEKGEFDISKSATFTPGICNRLDRNTSGLVVAGKNLLALQQLNKLFHDQNVDKYYTTLVKGEISKKGILEGYIVKNQESNEVFITNQKEENSKKVITEYTPLKTTSEYSLLKVKLVTGKSHQIRAHFKSINHPIVGDRKYGDLETNTYFRNKYSIDKQLLHANELIFYTNELPLKYLNKKRITSDLPFVFKKIIKDLNLE